MIKKLFLITLILFISLSLFSTEEMPVLTEKISSNVLLVKTGVEDTDLVSAIRTNKGIVIVDTGISHTFTRKYRKRIEEEWKGLPFRYAINTHYHFDHSTGNQVFNEATLIGHRLCKDYMIDYNSRRAEDLAGRKKQVASWKKRLESLKKGSAEWKTYKTLVYTYGQHCVDMEKGFKIRYPDITFNDRMSLKVGETEFNIYYYGVGGHTGDDAIIHVPSEKILFTGDLFSSGWIKLSTRREIDLKRWIDVLSELFNEKSDIQTIVSSHFGKLTRSHMDLRVRYYKDLYKLKSEKGKYKNVENPELKKRFSYIKGFKMDPKTLQSQHQSNLKLMLEL